MYSFNLSSVCLTHDFVSRDLHLKWLSMLILGPRPLLAVEMRTVPYLIEFNLTAPIGGNEPLNGAAKWLFACKVLTIAVDSNIDANNS